MEQNESRKAYVYLLIDPTTGKPFYVGKGHDYRDSSHLKPSNWKSPNDTCNPFLYNKIKSLMESGNPPITKRIHENLSEDDAYRLEHEYIETHGRRFVDGGTLFNISEQSGGSSKGVPKPWSEEAKAYYKLWCKSQRKYDPSYQDLYEDYIVKGKTRKKIAEENGVSAVLVKQRLKQLGITKPKSVQYPKRNEWTCQECGIDFTTPKSVDERKYCSISCRTKAKALEHEQKRSRTIPPQSNEKRKD